MVLQKLQEKAAWRPILEALAEKSGETLLRAHYDTALSEERSPEALRWNELSALYTRDRFTPYASGQSASGRLLNPETPVRYVIREEIDSLHSGEYIEEIAGKGRRGAVPGTSTLIGKGEGEVFGKYASKATPVDGYTDVIIHGAPPNKVGVMHNGKWVYLDQRSLANYLKQDAGYMGAQYDFYHAARALLLLDLHRI